MKLFQQKHRGFPLFLTVVGTLVCCTLATASFAKDGNTLDQPSLSVDKLNLAYSDSAATLSKTNPFAKLQTISAPPLPPVTYFPLEKQYNTYLTQFILNYNRHLHWEQANLISSTILHFSHYYQIDFRLLAGVIAVESSFRSDAISTSGAIGLGQLKPTTAQWLGISNPFDPIENVAGSARYLSFLLSRYNGSLDHALAAYYQGQGTVDREGIPEVAIAYLTKVNTVLKRF